MFLFWWRRRCETFKSAACRWKYEKKKSQNKQQTHPQMWETSDIRVRLNCVNVRITTELQAAWNQPDLSVWGAPRLHTFPGNKKSPSVRPAIVWFELEMRSCRVYRRSPEFSYRYWVCLPRYTSSNCLIRQLWARSRSHKVLTCLYCNSTSCCFKIDVGLQMILDGDCSQHLFVTCIFFQQKCLEIKMFFLYCVVISASCWLAVKVPPN